MHDSLVFLSFGRQEGCPLPPMESMISGCLVVGFDGFGGKEYFKPEFSFPIVSGDVISFAKTVETLIREYEKDPTDLDKKRKAASDFILSNYTPKNEKQALIKFWKSLILAE